MAYVTSKKMLEAAHAGKYAVGAFNVENMEMVRAVIRAAEELSAPVILQTTPSTVKYASLDIFHSLVLGAAEQSKVPIALHLDHGSSVLLAQEALKSGYSSIMIDGSHEGFEENVAMTKAVVNLCKVLSVPVEGELGKVGGKEDDIETKGDNNTDPNEAKEFVERTQVSSLAIGIGTAHGFYTGTPVLDKERLSQIRELVSIPLVLHGASGLSEEEVKECIKRGIAKVNFATELRVAFTDGIKKVLEESPNVFDPKILGIAGMEKVTQLVKEKMLVCGCDQKA